jgi:TrmH family RNA methyltransferase
MFHVPFVVDVDINETVAALKAAGIQVLAADATGDALPVLAQDGSLKEPTAWLFGNEAWGFEPEILALADRVVAVPIYGAAESLNLATAASVCLYSSAFAQNSVAS